MINYNDIPLQRNLTQDTDRNAGQLAFDVLVCAGAVTEVRLDPLSFHRVPGGCVDR